MRALFAPTTIGQHRRMALHADLILCNGRIATMARDRRIVTALAAHRGRIVALGADHEITGLGGPGTRIVLRGRDARRGHTNAQVPDPADAS